MALEYRYVSTYWSATIIAMCLSFVGWALVIVSVLVLLAYIAEFPGVSLAQESDILYLRLLIPVGGIVVGFLVVAVSHFLRAMLDSADHNGEILAIMKANLAAVNIAEEF